MISVRKCYKCQKCFSTNTKTDCHSMLLLNATKDNNNSLQSLIDDHMKTDSIDGYTCEHCLSKSDQTHLHGRAKITKELNAKQPDTLFIQLNRFKSTIIVKLSKIVLPKDNSAVSISHELDSIGSDKYKLKGFINHRGGNS